jgi:hypothetical protein
MEMNAYCTICKKDYVITDFTNKKCPYNKEHGKNEGENKLTNSSFKDTLTEYIKIVSIFKNKGKTLMDFEIWLDNRIKEAENQSSQFSYQNEGKDIGNLYAFDSRLETLKEIKDKLNQIEQEVNRIYPLKE